MAKRRHLVEEDEEPVSQASSKRARTAGSDDESQEEATQTQTRPKRERDTKKKGKGKAKAKGDESEPESSEDDGEIRAPLEDDIDDEEFERVHGDKLRAHLGRVKKSPGVRYPPFYSLLLTPC